MSESVNEKSRERTEHKMNLIMKKAHGLYYYLVDQQKIHPGNKRIVHICNQLVPLLSQPAAIQFVIECYLLRYWEQQPDGSGYALNVEKLRAEANEERKKLANGGVSAETVEQLNKHWEEIEQDLANEEQLPEDVQQKVERYFNCFCDIYTYKDEDDDENEDDK